MSGEYSVHINYNGYEYKCYLPEHCNEIGYVIKAAKIHLTTALLKYHGRGAKPTVIIRLKTAEFKQEDL